MKKHILFLLVIFTQYKCAAKDPIKNLIASLEHFYVPYGKSEVLEKDITTVYGSGFLIDKQNYYRRRIFYDQKVNLWIQFEFDTDLENHPLVEVVITRIAFDIPKVTGLKRIILPDSILRFLKMRKNELDSAFMTGFWRRNQSAYVPKVDGLILQPKTINNIIYPIEFYFNKGEIVALDIASP